ncbi:ABC transporter permease [Cohnella sp. GCM10027633]|uniref:ABC transporter permease n=1 Tax=unclassified Cohnella TaxID=2636738 RepID=UPI003645164E
MKLAKLAWANIRKSKSATVSLMLLIVIATMLLSTGISVISRMSSFYDDKVAQLGDPHISIVADQAHYKQEYEAYFRRIAGVKEIETLPALYLPMAKFAYGDSEAMRGIALLNADSERKRKPLMLAEKLADVGQEDIYVSYSFKSSGGYALGDPLTITFQDRPFAFRIAGFFESTMMGTNNMGAMKFWMPGNSFSALADRIGASANGTMLSVTVGDSGESTSMLADFKETFVETAIAMNAGQLFAIDVQTSKDGNSISINIIAMILVLFAALIVGVSLIVIKFRVTNMINDGIVNIGVLKALGYTTRQIIASIALQFMMIVLAAGAAGASASSAIQSIFGRMITSFTGLITIPSFDAIPKIASVLIVFVLVASVVLITSLRIRSLHPVMALRGGLSTHSAKKNYFPLESAKGGLQFLLALKTMFANMKQNVMIALIIVSVTFASVFSIVLFYNVSQDKTAFLHLVGAETYNVGVNAKPAADMVRLKADIEKMERVTKTVLFDMTSAKIDDRLLDVNVVDDFGKLNNSMLIEGRHPKHDNELSLSLKVSELLDKGVGDTVTLTSGEASRPMLITGMTQYMNNMGEATYVTIPGMLQVMPDYKPDSLYVYVDGSDNASFIRDVKAKYGSELDDVMDVDELIKSQSKAMLSALFVVMALILTITAFVVALILYLVISTMILKRKREFGIMKATGYTTFQLKSQIAYSFMPVIVFGVAVGGALGCLYTNKMLAMLMAGGGVQKVSFIVKIPVMAALCAGLVALAYFVSMLVARRIKRITAYGLITE